MSLTKQGERRDGEENPKGRVCGPRAKWFLNRIKLPGGSGGEKVLQVTFRGK